MKKFLTLLLVIACLFTCVSPSSAGYALFAQRKAQIEKLYKELEEAKRSGDIAREKSLKEALDKYSREFQESLKSLKGGEILENKKPKFTGLK